MSKPVLAADSNSKVVNYDRGMLHVIHNCLRIGQILPNLLFTCFEGWSFTFKCNNMDDMYGVHLARAAVNAAARFLF